MGYFDSHFKTWKSLDMWDFYYLMFGQRHVHDCECCCIFDLVLSCKYKILFILLELKIFNLFSLSAKMCFIWYIFWGFLGLHKSSLLKKLCLPGSEHLCCDPVCFVKERKKPSTLTEFHCFWAFEHPFFFSWFVALLWNQDIFRLKQTYVLFLWFSSFGDVLTSGLKQR